VVLPNRLTGANFHNGTIEVDVAGTLDIEATRDARGFVGIAFRIPEDLCNMKES
jgi:hypothetical protein